MKPFEMLKRLSGGQTRPLAIEIVAYDERWPRHFEELAACLKANLGDLAVGIEHVGSTAVPGLSAKPVIDIDVVIDSRQDLMSVVRVLNDLGYDHEGDLGVAGREAFTRRDGRAPMTSDDEGVWPEHHLYVCARDSSELNWHILFRNLLRKEERTRISYERLKKRLALKHGADREAYSKGKGRFIDSVLSGARQRRWSGAIGLFLG